MSGISTGSCQCGTVRFRIAGSFAHFFLCHCRRCRKDTGSAHAANLFTAGATLDWLSGEENLRSYAIAGTRHAKSFCATCGAALPRVEADGAWLVVPAGSLDTPVNMTPDAHICWASRADWDDRLENVSRLDGLPG
ncbi:GFA family protein [Ancylobacter terrae]|uniref:GFA family protein n=1 Tax=Ancylobacter sp. sgz301288 TaxID=3342077 RepID=UPI00385977EE